MRSRLIFLISLTSPLLCSPFYAIADETEAIAATAGSVERNGSHLLIHLKSRKTKTFADSSLCQDESAAYADSCYVFKFDHYDRANGLFVVRIHFYEGGDYILVDERTGEQTQMQSAPNFSPRGDAAVELIYGEDHYYAGHPTMNVWRRVGAKFVREWSKPIIAGDDTFYSVLGWPSNDRIDIEAVAVPSRHVEGSTKRFSIVREGNDWGVVDR